jgi:hypothetical protein
LKIKVKKTVVVLKIANFDKFYLMTNPRYENLNPETENTGMVSKGFRGCSVLYINKICLRF